MPTSEKVRKLVEIYGDLSVEERREFVDLVAPAERETGQVNEEWRAEIRSRAEDIDAGRVDLVDGEDFLQRLRAI